MGLLIKTLSHLQVDNNLLLYQAIIQYSVAEERLVNFYLNKYRIIVELTSVVAIILSLVFLGLEVKQSNQLAKAEIRQALNVTDMEVYKVQMEEDIIAKALYKINKNIPIDDYEEYQLDEFQRFNFRDFDNSFYQYRIGLFDENVWFAYRRIIKSLLMQNYIMIMWGNSNQSFSIEFQYEVNNIIKEIKDDVAFGLKENATKVN